MKKIVIITILYFIVLLINSNMCVYGAMYYELPLQYGNYSYSSEYEKYIGLYYTTDWQGGPSHEAFSSSISLYQNIFNLNLTVKKSELDKWFSESPSAKGGIVCYKNYSLGELENVFQKCNEYKMDSSSEIYDKTKSKLILEKGTLTITDDSGKTLATLPHYVICEREDYYIHSGPGGTLKRFYIKEYRGTTSPGQMKNSIDSIMNIVRSDSDDYFWGDAAAWFGQAQGGYTTPTQITKIVNTFTDMINVVGTTVIIIATIVLGIRYVIGSVESQTAAKEGLITLLIACVFFFGWTSISNLLYGGNQMDFIFTSELDTSYTDMVGRIFTTFSYIAQFVVVGAIIYVGIKYIFAGASGRAELKGKSVYFIIGIILVFATSNVLDFISKIINDAI